MVGAENIVQRVLSKVYTNNTLVDAALLTVEHAGHCLAVREAGGEHPQTGAQALTLCVLDSATSAFADSMCHTTLEMALQQLRWKEIVSAKVRAAC